MRSVRLLIGPGTLPSQGVDRLDMLKYGVWISGRQPLDGHALLEAVPEIAQFANVTVDAGNPHPMATFDDLKRLALHIEALARDPSVDGIVWVQGTNSIEENAYFLNLTVHTDKPVIVTGAQRPFTALSSDGPLNLLNAIRVAACDEARGKGVLVVTNGEINAARDVTKTDTYRLQTFRSRELGVLGYADVDQIEFYRAPLRRHTRDSVFDLSKVAAMPRVDIIYVFTGARADLAQAAVKLGTKGLVIAGSGAGSAGDLSKPLAEIVKQGIPVVRAARVGLGRVIRDDNWQEPGMIAGDNLLPQKAAVLLSIALTRTHDPDTIQRWFDEY